jgi:hypothetical protein
MKICYHVVLCRPEGSKTWVPYLCEKERVVGNFFSSIPEAMDYIRARSLHNNSLPKTKKYVPPMQFKIASVCISHDVPDNPNPEHS